jgi:precorrin-3B synthase
MRRRGRNPTLHAPLEVGDGWLARLKPPFHRLPSLAARDLALFAEREARGPIELTNRGNLQLRGLSREAARLLAAWAVKRGLAAADPALEERRNIALSPLAGLDPGLDPALPALAEALAATLGSEAGRALGGRVSFTLIAGGAIPLDDIAGTLTLTALGSGRWRVASAAQAEIAADVEEAARLALRLAAAAPPLPPRRSFHPPEVGFLPLGTARGQSRGALALAPPLGLLEPAALRRAAIWSERYADATLRISPHRSLLLAPIAEDDARALLGEAAALGLLTDPADPRRSLIACAGRPGCDGADAPSREDALRLAPLLPASVAGPVHISGCAKGCAWRGTAPVTLVGVGADERGGLYDLVFDADCDHAGVRADHRLLSIEAAARLIARKADDDARARLSP